MQERDEVYNPGYYQEREEAFNLGYYIDLLIRRRWLVIIPFCLAMIVGIYLAFALPRIYEASSLILVRPQRVPESYVQSIVTTDIESRINTIQQQILSRTNLEKIISQFNLFSDHDQEKMFLEDKIANLRSRIEIEIETSGPKKRNRTADAFSITFSGTEPELVMRVANGLATFFIDENLKVREAQAVSTSDFLDDELLAMRKRLEGLEQQLKDYRKNHMGELPEQLETNLRILERLQMQLNEKQESLRDEKSRLSAIEGQMEANRKFLTESRAALTEEGGSVSLEQLRVQLAALRSSYTDSHPDVIRLQEKIADLEESFRSGELSASSSLPAGASSDPTALMLQKSLDEHSRQRSQARLEIQNLEVEIANLERQIKEYQQRIERTPQNEQELLSLERDYKNIKQSYDSLVNRKLEAEIAVNMEKKQKGEQFSIIDSAVIPQKPVSPNMKRLLLLCIFAGLGGGGVLIYVLGFLDSSFRGRDDFELDLGIPVLVTVPKIFHRKDYWRQRVNRVLTAVALFVAACLLAGFAVLVFNGVEQTLDIVRPYMAFLG
ncbi:MAG: protein GumC [Deltaproteobacteria bacterium]|jgi:polysaccharide chain length determinant protein (PEP-CTERM system associated)|nr:protein GumC [Deltaproteobacteria bacterium]